MFRSHHCLDISHSPTTQPQPRHSEMGSSIGHVKSQVVEKVKRLCKPQNNKQDKASSMWLKVAWCLNNKGDNSFEAFWDQQNIEWGEV